MRSLVLRQLAVTAILLSSYEFVFCLSAGPSCFGQSLFSVSGMVIGFSFANVVVAVAGVLLCTRLKAGLETLFSVLTVYLSATAMGSFMVAAGVGGMATSVLLIWFAFFGVPVTVAFGRLYAALRPEQVQNMPAVYSAFMAQYLVSGFFVLMVPSLCYILKSLSAFFLQEKIVV